MKDDRDQNFVIQLMKVRRKIETVIGQLTAQFNIERVRARDLWHLTNRFIRKILAHTMAVFVNKTFERDLLKFDGLVMA